jgi:hypothetical protein
MNAKALASHLSGLGIRLLPVQSPGVRWQTSPSNGYPFPTQNFSSLDKVDEHWRKVVSVRFSEFSAAQKAWKACDDELEKERMLKWAHGELSQIPAPLLLELAKPRGPLPVFWRKSAENMSSRLGGAAFSWLHEAVLEAAGHPLPSSDIDWMA